MPVPAITVAAFLACYLAVRGRRVAWTSQQIEDRAALIGRRHGVTRAAIRRVLAMNKAKIRQAMVDATVTA